MVVIVEHMKFCVTNHRKTLTTIVEIVVRHRGRDGDAGSFGEHVVVSVLIEEQVVLDNVAFGSGPHVKYTVPVVESDSVKGIVDDVHGTADASSVGPYEVTSSDHGVVVESDDGVVAFTDVYRSLAASESIVALFVISFPATNLAES